ncbi:MAG: SDR family oxidoreductase, partial [Candidatus Hodarchaeota archaeon]
GKIMSNDELHVVLGASGALGSAVVRELAKRGKSLRGVNRNGRSTLPEGIEHVKADITDLNSARKACNGATVIYHCVAPPYNKWTELHPPIMENIIETAANVGAKVVYGDNLYMYGPVDKPLTEDLPCNASGPKGKVRAAIANQLMDAHQNGKIAATIGRASDFYGPGVRLSHFGERVVPNVLQGKQADFLGNPDILHTYTFIDDFANALVTLAENDKALGEIWHVPNAATMTTRQLFELAFEEAGFEPKIGTPPGFILKLLGIFHPGVRELKETRYQIVEPWIVDHSKFEKAFGDLSTPHREAIRQTLDWFKKSA